MNLDEVNWVGGTDAIEIMQSQITTFLAAPVAA
jgi:hypothetical protein